MTDAMRVALSVDSLSVNLSGIGRYCWELARGLGTDERVSNLRYFLGETWIADPLTLMRADSAQPKRRPYRNALSHWWNVRSPEAMVVHAPNYFLPAWAERGVATIHDLSVFKYPETHPLERIKAFEAGFAATIARAELILTDCEWMRREVLQYTGVNPERVVAVPLGIGPEFGPRSTEELSAFAARLGLMPGRYGLCVSTLEPRKRIGHLIAAWRALPQDVRTRYPLVIAGGSGWRNESLMADIERGQAEGWLHHLGYVAEADLPLLYAGARIFAYPSLYEGFGFPPLEAMASGVPCIVAADTCLEETAGPAAALIDPEDGASFTQTLLRILVDEDEHGRMASSGIQHASHYDWKRCIAATVDAYETMLRG